MFSCTSDSHEKQVKKTILKYLTYLPYAYKHGEFKNLSVVTGGKVLNKIDNTYQSYLNGANLVLESELISFDYEKVEIGSATGEDEIVEVWNEEEKQWVEEYTSGNSFVTTKEHWRYKWVDAKTFEVKSPEVDVEYTIDYEIGKVDNLYIIVDLKITNENIFSQEGEWLTDKVPGH